MIFVTGGAFQGKTEYVKTHYGLDEKIIQQYHKRIRKQLQEGKDPIKEASALLEKELTDNLIIICDEVGSGVVPMKQEERIYREMTGRVSCYFAKEATEVIRVVAGIGMKIK